MSSMICKIRFEMEESGETASYDLLEEKTFIIEGVAPGEEAQAETALYAGVEYFARGMRRYLEAHE